MSTSLFRHPHCASQPVSYSFLKKHSLFPWHAAKRSSMEPQSNNLLKEFHPSGKRVKLLPPGFVFILVINQIPKESWKKFKGERREAAALLYLPCDSQEDFHCTFPCLKCSAECSLLFLVIFSKSSYIGTVVCTCVCIYMHTCMDSVPRNADPLPFVLSCITS